MPDHFAGARTLVLRGSAGPIGARSVASTLQVGPVRSARQYTTGHRALDEVLTGVRPGDNIVWQVDDVEDYAPFVDWFSSHATRARQNLVYFRFAPHRHLLGEGIDAEVHRLQPELGFEDFISEIFNVVERVGMGGYYVFDCLSDLAVDWYSDRMLGNFFMLTCPYLYDFDTVSYFALLRSRHTRRATDAIHQTAQVVIDAYRNKKGLYVHPLKVQQRHSEAMYTLHSCSAERVEPVTESAIISEILTSATQPWLDFAVREPDLWTRTLREAHELAEAAATGGARRRAEKRVFRKLVSMILTRDPRVASLAERYLDLEDLVAVGKRMIGTGLIGGKAVGMVLAAGILRRTDPRWEERLEPLDSFFVGADVFYTYLIQNGCWWVRRQRPDPDALITRAREARQRLLKGTFSADLRSQFAGMLEYFGQSPIIVRSSSLLEDAYGNAFSGKYTSVFCANQGTPADRLDGFMDAVRAVYASTMSREALGYRTHWNLLEQDEQMALLVQRVSGRRYGNLYYPQLAGVGFSFNPFAWSREIDPQAGVLRLVVGLGTRAVDRSDDDYTHVVALNAPLRSPLTETQARQYTQRRVDVLDLRSNQATTRDFDDLVEASPGLPVVLFGKHDDPLAEPRPRSMKTPWRLSFERLLGETSFAEDLREILTTLARAYSHPIDIEFTANFVNERDCRIGVVQCRPFQVQGRGATVAIPKRIADSRIVLHSRGPVIGHGVSTYIDRVVLVVPRVYSTLPMRERYAVARLVGEVSHLKGDRAAGKLMLVGPGRWGTTTPALGVPVTIDEIENARVICEIVQMHRGLIPDVSLGTHFFNDLVEMDMLVFAVHPEHTTDRVNYDLIQGIPNRLHELVPQAAAFENVVRVIDFGPEQLWGCCCLHADSVTQEAIAYVKKAGTPGSRRARKDEGVELD